MYHIILGLHMTVCALLILIVLLQAGRGAGLAVFGSSGDALATPSGSSFLKKFTAVLAGTFALTSLMLTLLAGRVGNSSVTRSRFEVPLATQQPQAPAQPAAPATKGPMAADAPAKAEQKPAEKK